MTVGYVAAVLSLACFASFIGAAWERYERRRVILRMRVYSNLESALEGDYFVRGEYLCGATAEEIAFDLRAFAEDMTPYTTKQLTPHVQAWLDARRHRLQFELERFAT